MEYSSTITFRVLENNTVNVAETYSGSNVTVTDFIRKVLSVAPATVDLALDFGYVTSAKYIYMSTTKPVSLKVNATVNTAIPITTLLVLETSSVTSLYISNSGTEAATVTFILIG